MTAVSTNLRLQSIYLHSAHSTRASGDPSSLGELVTTGSINHQWVGDEALAYLVSMEYDQLDVAGDSVLKGTVHYVAMYEYTGSPDELPDESQLEVYGLGGAAFQVHPYIRAHVADTAMRSGVSGVLVPILLRHEIHDRYEFDQDGDDD